MAANGISTLTIASGTTLTKNINPPHTNAEIVPPYSAIWSLNYAGALGATNDISYKLYVTSLGIGSAFTLTSHSTGDFAVTAGNFLYDEYGTSIGIIKGNATIDNYMAKAAAVCGSLDATIITAATYKGTWNAFTNTPTLTDGVGTLGDAYDNTVAGTSGAYPAYGEQDWRIYDGAVWQRVDKITTTQWTIKPAAGGLADKEARQIAKLDLAQTRRQAAGDTTKPYYRENNTYDIDNLPTKYSGNTLVNNSNPGGLLLGRPWINVASITFTSGVYHRTVTGTTNANGYFGTDFTPANDDLTFFDTYAATSQGVYTSLNLSSLPEYSSIMLTGYFLAPTTDTYTFYTSTDDASYMWIGPDAITGYTHTNAVVKNGGLHGVTEVSGTVAMTANIYYPFRVMFGNLTGPGTMTVSWASGTQAKTSNWSGKLFYNSATNGH